MSALRNPKWELFVTTYSQNGGNGRAAYHAAYPNVTDKTADNNASRLLRRADVLRRLTELHDIAAHETIKAIADAGLTAETKARDAATLCAIASESLIAMANGDAWDVTQAKDAETGEWKDVKRTYRSDVRRSAAETVLKMYGARQQETIRVELVGDVGDLAD